MLMRDYVGYGERVPNLLWPGGAAVAVSVVVNIEDGAERSTARGDPVDDSLAHWERHRVFAGQRNLTLESAFDYGSRAGIWRVLRTLREFEVRATAFSCAQALQLNPAIARALVRDGHEIANHGLRWDTHTTLAPAAESVSICSSTALITELTGIRPVCWYSRDGLTPHTLAIAREQGYGYDSNSFCEDAPYTVSVGDGELPVVPYAGDTNDSGLLTSFPTAGAFSDYLCDALAMLLADARPGPSVLSVGLHPRLVGRPAYIKALRAFLAYATGPVATWFATRAEIASYWLANAGSS
jgi:peptidoglycan/xylan/chitin deacetylase (PgdA/CDA1 family)